jgi:hypothetical protein
MIESRSRVLQRGTLLMDGITIGLTQIVKPARFARWLRLVSLKR